MTTLGQQLATARIRTGKSRGGAVPAEQMLRCRIHESTRLETHEEHEHGCPASPCDCVPDTVTICPVCEGRAAEPALPVKLCRSGLHELPPGAEGCGACSRAVRAESRRIYDERMKAKGSTTPS